MGVPAIWGPPSKVVGHFGSRQAPRDESPLEKGLTYAEREGYLAQSSPLPHLNHRCGLCVILGGNLFVRYWCARLGRSPR